MTVRGRLAQLPKGVAKQEKEIMHLYYDLGIKQKDIKEKLNSMSAKELRKKYYIEHSYVLEVAASRFEKLLNTHQKILDC